MRKTLQSLVKTAAFLPFTIGASVAQDFDSVEMKVHPVAGNVSYIEGMGGNIGLFAGADGVFLIDDQYAPLTEKIVAAVRTVSAEPIRFLVNTHMHPDHTGGNENFGKMGTMIFGHDNVRSQMGVADYKEAPPLVTFSDDMSFHINGETVHVFKTPNAHTNGDVFVRFAGSNVVHTGDVYRTTSYPYVDVANGGSFLGTIKAYDLLIEVSDAATKIVPGHGVISNVGEVRAFRDMMLVIRDRTAAAIRNGMTLEQAQGAGLTAEYDERWESGRPIGSSAKLLEAAYADMAQ
ncbi:MAG: MBL fold metallo-hydrolase [Proteobacteria bacterium]|nr:MBL fold metallo-hydrolase [Pseudomonadota bacterium]MDA0994500.1 MBL fold metallo-hydrolase [Pseudomonadota bacterium]